MPTVVFSRFSGLFACFLSVFALCFALNGLGNKAWAESKTLRFGGLTLNGELEIPEGKSLADGVVLLTHGTLAHNKMEIITGLQERLKERDIASLAITLSLGIDARQGMYDCKVPHTHQHTDAMDEIRAWLDWLKTQGAGPVTLAGHSRGGNQTAWFAARDDDPAFDKVVLIAPATWDAKDSAAGYEKRYGQKLVDVYGKAKALVDAGKGDEMLTNIGFIYCADASASAKAFVNYYADDPRMDTPYLLKMMSKPTLVVTASEDQVVKGLGAKVMPLAGNSKINLVEVDGADHFFLDFYADDLADAIAEFING